MAQDLYNNPDVQYDSYLEPEIDPFIQQILATTAITSINGISGPTVTFAGGTSGFSFAPGGTTLTLVSPLTAKGDLYTHSSTAGVALAVGTNGFVLSANSGTTTGLEWIANATGTVTSVSVVSANGFAGTVATATTTPAITLTTTINAPVLAGNGTAISAATTTGTGSTAVLQTAPSLGGSVGFLSAALANRMTITGSETENQIVTSGGTDFAINSAGSLFLRTNGSTVALTLSTAQAATFASTVAATIFNASTGFRISNAATSGNYLRGNGTNFVSSAIQSGDVTTALGYTPTDAAVVPSTAPSAGQILVGNAGNTAYAKQTVSGSGATITLASTGVMTISGIANASLTNSAITINGTSVSLGGTRTLTLASADFANQGTTTTVLHGNAAGNPSFAAVSLSADISGTLGADHGGTGVANNASSTLTISGNFATTLTVTGATGVTLPTTGTLATLAGSEELTNKTLTSSVGKGTWTASGTWTLPAITLGGTVSGGGNQLNNIIIGTSTPLAGSFTTGVFSGNVAIGLTTASDRLHVRGASNNAGMEFGNTTVGGADYNAIISFDRVASAWRGIEMIGNEIRMIGQTNGVILNNAATSWSAISDEREKVMSEWEPFTGALDKLRNLRTGISRFKADPEGTRRPFLIAQDVQKILPEAVKEHGGKLTLSYTELIPLIIAAINELGRGKLEANA